MEDPIVTEATEAPVSAPQPEVVAPALPWEPTRPVGVYSYHQVVGAVAVAYVLLLLFGARGLNNWAARLPVSPVAVATQRATEAWWNATSKVGLEMPAVWFETAMMTAQGAPSFAMPKTRSEILAHRVAHRASLRLAAKAARVAPVVASKPEKKVETKASSFGRFDDALGRAEAEGPTVLLVGDSLMQGIGPTLRHDILERLDGKVVLDGRLSTGLSRPDVYDWPKAVKRHGKDRRFDYAVVMIGTNDSQDFMEQRRILSYGTKEWVEAYEKRLEAMMASTCEAASQVIWIALPPMRSAAFQRKAARINSWVQKAANAREECVKYLPLESVLGDSQGAYSTYIRLAGRLERVRMVDGIHLSLRGGTLVSEALLPELRTPQRTAFTH